MLNIIAGSLSVGVTPSTNSYESIATVTVGSGGSSSINFTSIPTTYTHLQIRAIAVYGVSTSYNMRLRLNSDSGSNYAYHGIYGNGSSAAAISGTANTFAYLGNSISTQPNPLVIDLLDYTNTNKNTTLRILEGFDANGSGLVMFNSGLWLNTAAVNAIEILTEGGASYAQYTQFALYGIKGV